MGRKKRARSNSAAGFEVGSIRPQVAPVAVALLREAAQHGIAEGPTRCGRGSDYWWAQRDVATRGEAVVVSTGDSSTHDVSKNMPITSESRSVPAKFWKRRHLLWHRFDAGVRMDFEGWYSVTPEPIAMRMASVLAAACQASVQTATTDLLVALDDALASTSTSVHHTSPRPERSCSSAATRRAFTVIDLFAGCGGNTIALARHRDVAHVIAVDIDGARLSLAEHNAAVYGIPRERITWVVADAGEVIAAALAAAQPLPDGSVQAVASQRDYTCCSSNSAAMIPLTFRRAPTCIVGSKDGTLPAPRLLVQAAGGIERSLDAIVLAPPWGGLSYGEVGGFDMRAHISIATGSALRILEALRARGHVGAGTVRAYSESDAVVSAPGTIQSRSGGMTSSGDSQSTGALHRDEVGERDAQSNSSIVLSLQGDDLWWAASMIAPVVVLYVPRTADMAALKCLASSIRCGACSAPEQGGVCLVERCATGNAPVPVALCLYNVRSMPP